MPATESFLELLADLLASTRAGAVQWSETADENSFRAVFRRGMVSVEKPQQVPGSANPPFPYQAGLRSLYGSSLHELIPQTEEEERLLKDLYEAARESALQGDEVVRSIREELAARANRGRRNGN